jgi:TrmH family RNA methyltransferase
MSINEIKLKKYNKKYNYSYTWGAFPTIELLKCRPNSAVKILVHEDFDSENQIGLIQELCLKDEIPYLVTSKQIERIREKENCYIIGVVKKYEQRINQRSSHIVLVDPRDSGNMGTIIRTCIGFGINDIAIIGSGVDLFHPKVIRASMGAIFRIRFSFYQNFEEYLSENAPGRKIFPFMLKGALALSEIRHQKEEVFSLIFGNEATGLSDKFLDYGQSICINHGNEIDSLNLSVALGIGLYEFTKNQ